MARRKSSAFSVRLQLRSWPLALRSLKDSMSEMNGAVARPRPCDAVDAALLLVEGPRRLVQHLEQLGPLDAGLDLDQAAVVIGDQDARELARVDEDAVGGEGLRAHRVTPAAHAQRALLALRELERRLHAFERVGLGDAVDERAGQLALLVVDRDAFGLLRLAPAERGGPRRAKSGNTQEFAAAAHRVRPF
jgi:hypothetical protein